MTYTYTHYNRSTMNSHASAPAANAASCCANSSANTSILLIMGAIIMASIIICLRNLVGLSLIIIALLGILVLLVRGNCILPRMNVRA